MLMEAEVSQEGIVWGGWFGGNVRKINSATGGYAGLFVEPEGEPAGDGFFIAGLFVVSIPNIEGDGDGSAGLKLDIVVSPFKCAS